MFKKLCLIALPVLAVCVFLLPFIIGSIATGQNDKVIEIEIGKPRILTVDVELGNLPEPYLGANETTTSQPTINPDIIEVRMQLVFESSNESKATVDYNAGFNELRITGQSKSTSKDDVTISVKYNSSVLDTDTITVHWPNYITGGGTWQPGYSTNNHPPYEEVRWEIFSHTVKDQFGDAYGAGLKVGEAVYWWNPDTEVWEWLYQYGSHVFTTTDDGRWYDNPAMGDPITCFAYYHFWPADQHLRIDYTNWTNMWHFDKRSLGCIGGTPKAKLEIY